MTVSLSYLPRTNCKSVIELNDDDPGVFEFMSQFFYNVHSDLTLPLICRITTDIEERHLHLPIKVHTVADKYDAGRLQHRAVSTLKDNLAKRKDVDYRLKNEVCFRMFLTIGAYVARKNRPFINQQEGADLIHGYPAFGADILLALAPDLWKLR
jgi:hypothetical protein